jgi:hypothetical protein
MIRLIIECHNAEFWTEINRKEYVTIDVDLPELENLLTRGGKGENGFEMWRLVGAEVR